MLPSTPKYDFKSWSFQNNISYCETCSKSKTIASTANLDPKWKYDVLALAFLFWVHILEYLPLIGFEKLLCEFQSKDSCI